MMHVHEALVPLLRDIDTVRQHPDNPNNGDIDSIAESIEVNGYIAPVIVQRSTGYIVAGNHRYAAALSLGATEIPVIEVELSAEGARRYMLADNRTAQKAEMDNAALIALLRDMQTTDHGLVGTGYDEADMAYLLSLADQGGFGSGLDPDPDMGDGHEITCPRCGHTFGG